MIAGYVTSLVVASMANKPSEEESQ